MVRLGELWVLKKPPRGRRGSGFDAGWWDELLKGTV